jgi:hypothetical protein
MKLDLNQNLTDLMEVLGTEEMAHVNAGRAIRPIHIIPIYWRPILRPIMIPIYMVPTEIM